MILRAFVIAFTVLLTAPSLFCQSPSSSTDARDSLEMGTRRELMVDDYLIDSLQGAATLRLHHPVRHDDPELHGCIFYAAVA